MIVPMKKVSVITLEKHRETVTTELRELGLLHIHTRGESTETLAALNGKRDRLQRTLLLLPESEDTEKNKTETDDYSLTRMLEAADEIHTLEEEAKSLRDDLEKLAREESRFKLWGDFDPSDIASLNEKGVDIRLYSLPPEDVKKYFQGKTMFTVRRSKTLIHLAVVYQEGEESPPVPEEPLPEESLTVIKKRIEKKLLRLDEIEMDFVKFSAERNNFEKALDEIDEQIEYEEVKSGLTQEGSLAYISGFVPSDSVDDVYSHAREGGWGVLIRDPEPEEAVPTKVKNPRWIGIIQPVFSLLGITPGYRELDISFWFLSFFCVFFAMIIGDAGYGSLLFIGSILPAVKSKKKASRVPDGIVLIMVLSAFTIVWGAITGNWFGIESLVQGNTFFAKLVIPSLSTYNPESAQLVKQICFILGTLHLSVAHIWNFINELNSRPKIKAFAQLGWLSAVLGLYYLVLNLVLDAEKFPLPDYALYMILGGIIVVFLFSQQEGNFFKGIGKGLANFIPTALDGVGAFSDIISYIRLFAVGLASLEIAKSFNGMAESLGGGAVGIIGGIIILSLGHSLNLAMGALSVIVHGVRLNMLEFSGHLGMEWTGFAYSPFKKHGVGEDAN